MFRGKCGIPVSRGERARHFELLFVALYSRIVSTYEAEGCKIIQVELFHKITLLIFGGPARLEQD